MVNALGIHDLNAMDYAQSLTFDDTQSIGTDQPPPSTGLKPNPSVAQSNSYNVGLKLAQQALAEMLTAKLSGYDPDSALFSQAWPNYGSAISGPSVNNALIASSSNFSLTQWLFNNQNNWEGKTGLYLLQKATRGFTYLAEFLQPTAEMNPLISGTNALWGQDILNNNKLLSSTDRFFYGLTTATSFLDPIAGGIRSGVIWTEGRDSIPFDLCPREVLICNTDDGSEKSSTGYQYDASGYCSRSSTGNTDDNNSNHSDITCNADLFQTNQTTSSTGKSDGSDGTDTTTLNPDRDNNIWKQSTVHKPTSGHSVSYSLNFRNVLFEDTYQLSEVSGETSDDAGHEYTQALMYYDSNGTLNGKVGADNDDKDTDGKLSVYNVTTYDGLVMEKYQFPTDSHFYIDSVIEYYFYDIHNNYLSSYTLTVNNLDAGLKNSSPSNIKMRFEGIKNSGKWGHYDLDVQPPHSASTGEI